MDFQKNNDSKATKTQFSNGREMKDFLNSKAWKESEQSKHRLSLLVFGLEEKYGLAKKRVFEFTAAALQRLTKF
jgi:hypothetical protein